MTSVTNRLRMVSSSLGEFILGDVIVDLSLVQPAAFDQQLFHDRKAITRYPQFGQQRQDDGTKMIDIPRVELGFAAHQNAPYAAIAAGWATGLEPLMTQGNPFGPAAYDLTLTKPASRKA